MVSGRSEDTSIVEVLQAEDIGREEGRGSFNINFIKGAKKNPN